MVTSNSFAFRHIIIIALVGAALCLSSCAVKPFRIVLLPDTQSYSRAYPHIFNSQTDWIVSKADSITFVLHQGDITDDNIEPQWEVARAAMSRMDGKVPYAFVMGNHDIGKNADTRDSELFNRYFSFDKYSARKHFGGVFEEGKMDNSWHTFAGGGIKWLVVCLEFGPRDVVLQWADSLIAAHKKHKVIINTHAYMYSDDTRMGEGDDWLPQSYGVGRSGGAGAVNNGEQVWQKLVSRHGNILFVFSGHVLHDGTGTLVSKGIHGNAVYQMLANYQAGVKGSENGGNGYLRILTLSPKKRTISVKTYSPYLNSFRTEPDQQFEFTNVKYK